MATQLRPYRASDRGDFKALFGDAEVMRHVGGPLAAPAAEALFEALLAGAHPRVVEAWAVVVDEAFAGHAVLFRAGEGAAELGVVLVRARWRGGHGTAAGAALLERARALGVARVEATVDLEHEASRRLLDRLGFRLTRLERDEEGAFAVYARPCPAEET